MTNRIPTASLTNLKPAAELTFGKSPDELTVITGKNILEILGGLPEKDRHCAFLAAETLQEALDYYMRRQRSKEEIRGSGEVEV